MSSLLALNTDGNFTRCTAKPENRGKGKCNHPLHQNENESESDFMVRAIPTIKKLKKSRPQRFDKDTNPKLQKVKDKTWNGFIEKLEEATGISIDSAYRESKNADKWVIGYKDGYEYEIEVERYSDGEYDLMGIGCTGSISD